MERIPGGLLYQLIMIGTLVSALQPLPAHAAAACPPTIQAQCYQAKGPAYLGGTPVQNGGEIVVAKGDPVTIRLQYCHGDDSDTLYAVKFTSTINTNVFTGSEHTFDTETLWGGADYSFGNNKDVPIDTASAPAGTGRVVINVTSDATGGVLATCDFTLTTLPPDGDADNDGLLNRWETNGIDADNDGTIDLKLSDEPYNAQWNHKDIFIEADYMDCAKGGCPANNATGDHRPHPNVFVNVAAAFAAAPVSNPDGKDGITLHLFLDEGTPYYQFLRFGSRPFLGSWDATFDELKLGADPSNPCDGYFGTAVERTAPDCSARLLARKMAFRYVLFGDLIAEAVGALGIAEMPGNDFFVRVQRIFDGGSFNKGSSEIYESNAFMHELGHTLGLSHGGSLADAGINCKPNYLSVMNYMQSWAKFNASQFPLDYSRQELPPLNENALNEAVGISGPAGRVAVYGVSGKQRSADAAGQIDWNGDGVTGGTVQADINWLDVFPEHCGPSSGQILRGHEDWHSLGYDFRQTVDYSDYSHATPRPEDEWTRDELERLRDDDLDTIINADDNCLTVPNRDQADRDHDDVGDACDPDSDPPTVNLVTPAEGAVYAFGSRVLASYSCADEPGGSGLASCLGTVVSGAAIDTSAVGSKTFTVTARDGEGHQTVVTHHYRVAYVFEGFFSPVDKDMLNLAKAGQAVPLKWRLTDDAGNPITNLATVSVTAISLACSVGQTVDEVEEYATGSSGLQNLGNGYYQVNWDTPKSYAKSCKTMQLDLGEGTPRTANFQFR